MKKTSHKLITTMLVVGLIPIAGHTNDSSKEGLLPEIRMTGEDHNADNKKALETELMISRSEQLAIKKLQEIIIKRRGQPDEPHLLYRLAELYMRRAKTGRFFEVFKSDDIMRLAPPEAKTESSKENINAAIRIYSSVESRFPKYHQMDEIYFHNAFAHQQLNRNNVAKKLYQDLLSKYPKSPYVPEAHLALGEMYYDAQDFQTAWNHFSAVQKLEGNRLYSFALYKGAWALYNLHRSNEAIQSLETLVKLNKDVSQKQMYDLRTEALRDLVVFYGDHRNAKEAVAYFSKLADGDELGKTVSLLAGLYQTHSREQDAINVLKELDRIQPKYVDRPKINLHMVELHEALRNRDAAIAQIKTLLEICAPNSSWAKSQPAETVNAVCADEAGQETLKLATKWWDLWKKNEHAPQFANWSEQAFALYLSVPNPKNEAKVRYSFAELLFQRKKYAEASFEYEKTASLETQDKDVAEKANYAALVSLEKSIANKWDDKSEKRLINLSKHLLEKFPESEHVDQVRFQMGFVAYDRGRLGVAKGHLKPLIETAKDQEIRVKAEDLFLDVLNQEKDFGGLRAWASRAAGSTKDSGRRSKLEEISREARMAEIEIIAKDNPAQAASAYESFYRDNSSHKMAKSALINAVRLSHESSNLLQAATLALEFSKEFSDDERVTTMLQEAARLFEETARPLEAAQTLEILAKHSKGENKAKWQEIAADYYAIEGQETRAIRLYLDLAKETNKAQQAKLYSKVYHIAPVNSPEKGSAQNKLVELQVEPYWSQLLLEDTRETFKKGKHTEAFALARRLVGQAKDPDIRAEARLIQADILKDEFLRQSVRTSLDRLTMVLSLKTEKLEKAQQAYLAAAKMSPSAHIQVRSLESLIEIYGAYVKDIQEMPTPRGIASEEENQMLRSELTALTQPIEQTQKQTQAELVNVNGKMLSAGARSGSSLGHHSSSQSLAPLVYQVQSALEVYVPYIGGKKL